MRHPRIPMKVHPLTHLLIYLFIGIAVLGQCAAIIDQVQNVQSAQNVQILRGIQEENAIHETNSAHKENTIQQENVIKKESTMQEARNELLVQERQHLQMAQKEEAIQNVLIAQGVREQQEIHKIEDVRHAQLQDFVDHVAADTCGCPGCCPPPIPRCCDPRCPKCLGGDVPVPDRRCASGCPGGACPFQCPCDACICCYTEKIFEYETRTCDEIAVLFFIGLEVSTVSILTTTTLTETKKVTYTADYIYVFTSVNFSSSLLPGPPSTVTVTDETTTTSTFVVGLTTVTVPIPTIIFSTFTSAVTTTPQVPFTLLAVSELGVGTFEVSILDSFLFTTTTGPTLFSTDTVTSLDLVDATGTVTEFETIGAGSYSPELTETAVENVFEIVSVDATVSISETFDERTDSLTLTETFTEDVEITAVTMVSQSLSTTFSITETVTQTSEPELPKKMYYYL